MLDTLFSNKEEDLVGYTKQEPTYQDGEYWYVQPGDGNRRRVSSHAKKNTTRMFVNGKYIPKSHPLHKPGNYKSLDDAWSHNKIESYAAGEVYAITNPAWPEWIKIGKAVNSADRLNGYQTGSPFRDFEVVHSIEGDDRHKSEKQLHQLLGGVADERINEWFKIELKEVKYIFSAYKEGLSNGKHSN